MLIIHTIVSFRNFKKKNERFSFIFHNWIFLFSINNHTQKQNTSTSCAIYYHFMKNLLTSFSILCYQLFSFSLLYLFSISFFPFFLYFFFLFRIFFIWQCWINFMSFYYFRQPTCFSLLSSRGMKFINQLACPFTHAKKSKCTSARSSSLGRNSMSFSIHHQNKRLVPQH